MQMPSIIRTPTVHPSTEVVASAAGRVIPVPPVNPSATRSVEPTPGVVNMVKPVGKPYEQEPMYASVSDPGKHGSEAATAPKDWTIHRPAPEKVEDPPPKPLYQVLMDHIKSMWTAGASAIQIEQVKNQLEQAPPVTPAQVPGNYAKEVLTYSPSKIRKNEQI